jgi:membrane-associated phospholipid phosphatase
MSLKTRLSYLVIGWLSCCLIYVASGFVREATWIIPETQIEQFIPFNPHGIWLYLGFYVYIPYTFITLKEESRMKRITFTFVLTACISGILFILLPSTLVFPHFKPDGVSTSLLYFISENDTEQNCFPSMHASLITICTLANWNNRNVLKSIGLIVLTIGMYYSIIAVRRHVFIDLAGGIILAALVWWLSKIFLSNSPKQDVL